MLELILLRQPDPTPASGGNTLVGGNGNDFAQPRPLHHQFRPRHIAGLRALWNIAKITMIGPRSRKYTQ